jgi:hypothetical protein
MVVQGLTVAWRVLKMFERVCHRVGSGSGHRRESASLRPRDPATLWLMLAFLFALFPAR